MKDRRAAKQFYEQEALEMQRSEEETARKEIAQHLSLIYSILFACLGEFEGSFIAGGAIASLVQNEPPNDYDVWFLSQACLDIALMKAKTAAQLDQCTILAETEYALTLRITGKPFDSGIIVQLVKSRLGPPQDVVASFDYKHTRGYYVEDDCVGLDAAGGYEFVKSKTLIFDQDTFLYPVNTMQRLVKFAQRGYSVSTLVIERLMLACAECDYPKDFGKANWKSNDKDGGSR